MAGYAGPEHRSADPAETTSVGAVLTAIVTHCVHGDADGEVGDVVATKTIGDGLATTAVAATYVALGYHLA